METKRNEGSGEDVTGVRNAEGIGAGGESVVQRVEDVRRDDRSGGSGEGVSTEDVSRLVPTESPEERAKRERVEFEKAERERAAADYAEEFSGYGSKVSAESDVVQAVMAFNPNDRGPQQAECYKLPGLRGGRSVV